MVTSSPARDTGGCSIIIRRRDVNHGALHTFQPRLSRQHRIAERYQSVRHLNLRLDRYNLRDQTVKYRWLVSRQLDQPFAARAGYLVEGPRNLFANLFRGSVL